MCNLLERFGETIDPPSLDTYFNQHGNFLLDPADGAGVRDNLGWGSVSAYNGNVVVVQIGGAGWPDSNDAIVKFIYKSPRTGHQVTHFTLVADHAAGRIVDSWDGVTKYSPYGTPVAWAKYERHHSQVVTPPPPAETPAFTLENIPERTEELKVDTHIWDLNQRTWPGLVNNPVGTGNAGTKFQTSQLAHHIMGGSYYLPAGSSTQGYNVADCEAPVVAPPTPVMPPMPAPIPVKTFTENTVNGIAYKVIDGAPKPMWVTRPKGAEKWSFKDATTWRNFVSVQHVDYGTRVFIVGVAHHPIPPKGADYYMVDEDFGNFKSSGTVTNECGFNWSDLSDTKPPALPPSVTAPVITTATPPVVTAPVAQVETPPIASTTPVNWKATFRSFPKATHYLATRDLTVEDLSGQQASMPLAKYNPGVSDTVGVVSAFGTVTKDGVEYYRLRTNNDPTFSFWYCIPKIDPETRTPNLLVMPVNPLEPVSKLSVARDTLELTRARIEADVPKFLDDILPKWFKNKK
jgi:hypothetical protein